MKYRIPYQTGAKPPKTVSTNNLTEAVQATQQPQQATQSRPF